MNGKVKAYLQLMRFPNTFTAMADVLAGFLLVSGSLQSDWISVTLLLAATTCIYGAGCVLNDIHDRKLDAAERPGRPLPSGRVTVRDASLFTVLLYATGLICSFFTGWRAFVIALILITCTMTYDLVLKDVKVLGPFNMASCRSLNLILGMSPILDVMTAFWIFPLITLAYVFYLTLLSQFEVSGAIRETRPSFILGGLLILASIFLVPLFETRPMDGIIFAGFFFLIVFPPVRAALSSMKAEDIGKAVKFLIIGLPFLDAMYVSATHGFLSAVPVALCIVPALVAGRYFYST